MPKYLNYNGTIYDEETPIILAKNRAFRYGDGIFETIRMNNYKILFIEEHFNRIVDGTTYLSMPLPENFSASSLINISSKLAEKNKIKDNARIRVEVFRVSNGFYFPESNQSAFIVQMEALNSSEFIMNEKGLKIDIYNEVQKSVCKLSNYKTINSLNYILAAIFRQKNALDDCILLNSTGNISECISSNIFLVRDNIFYTPSLNEACIDGIMRKQIIKLLKKEAKKIYECEIKTSDLLLADEIFLTNAINGIQWVAAYKEKRFYNNNSKWLLAKINELCSNSLLSGVAGKRNSIFFYF